MRWCFNAAATCISSLAMSRTVARAMAIGLMLVLTNGPDAGAQTPIVRPGPKFELVDQHGRRITDADLRAKPNVIHFGFTRCPVICPTTLYELAGYMRELGPLVDDINFIFVTVDPLRDTPSFMAEYMESFDRRIIGLSGGPTQIAALAAGLGAEFAKVPTSGNDYTMEHSVQAFLLETGWRNPSTIYMGDGSNEAKVLQVLRTLIEMGPPRSVSAPVAERVR